jgi:tetratricopeptide (TPR) repeat protein
MRSQLGSFSSLICAALLADTFWTAEAFAAEPSHPPLTDPQVLLQQGKPADFLAPAMAFLNSQSPRAESLQVASNLLMMGTIAKNEEAIRFAKLRLVADYPQSVTGKFLLSEMSGDDYGKFLKHCFASLDIAAEPGSLAIWNRAMDSGFARYGCRFADDELLAKAALAAEDPAKGEALRKSIRHIKDESRRTLEIAFDPNSASRQKILRLETRGKNSSLAKSYLKILYDMRLTPEEHADPEVAQVIARVLAKDKEFAKADAVLAKVRGKKGPLADQLLFLQGWAQGASGKSKEAIETLSLLIKDYPGSPWAKTAAELEPAIRNLDNNLKEYSAATDAALAVLRKSPPQRIEIRSQARWKTSMAAYVALDVAYDEAEVVLAKEGKTVAAVKASAENNRMFVQTNSSIHKSFDRYPIPYFRPRFTKPASGGWKVDYGFQSIPAGSALSANLTSLLSSSVLTRPDGREEYFAHVVREGSFPAPMETVGEHRIYRWLTPKCDRPELLVTEVRLGKDSELISASWGSVIAVQIKCGTSETLKFEPPAWPDLPVEPKEMDVSTLTQLGFQGAMFWESIGFWPIGTDGEEEPAEEAAKKEPKQ